PRRSRPNKVRPPARGQSTRATRRDSRSAKPWTQKEATGGGRQRSRPPPVIVWTARHEFLANGFFDPSVRASKPGILRPAKVWTMYIQDWDEHFPPRLPDLPKVAAPIPASPATRLMCDRTRIRASGT